MGFLSDIWDGFTGKSQQKATRRAANAANAKSEEYQDTANQELDRHAEGYAGLGQDVQALLAQLQGNLGSTVGGAQSRLGANLGMARRYAGDNTADIQRRIQQAIGTMGMMRSRGEQAINTSHDRAVSQGAAGINASMKARGLSGATTKDAAETSMRGNAAAGLAQAHGSLESDYIRGLSGAQMQGANMLANRYGQTESRDLQGRIYQAGQDRDMQNQSMALSQMYGNLGLDMKRAPIDFRASNKVNPNVLYPSLQFPTQQSSGGLFGQQILPIASTVASFIPG